MKNLHEKQAQQDENLRKLADNGENEEWTGEP